LKVVTSVAACFPWAVALSLGAQYFKAENIIYALLYRTFSMRLLSDTDITCSCYGVLRAIWL